MPLPIPIALSVGKDGGTLACERNCWCIYPALAGKSKEIWQLVQSRPELDGKGRCWMQRELAHIPGIVDAVLG